MVVDGIVSTILQIATFFVGLLPSITLPSWLQPSGPMQDAWQNLLTKFSDFGAWIPFDAIGTVGPFLLVLFGATLTIALLNGAMRLIKRLPFL